MSLMSSVKTQNNKAVENFLLNKRNQIIIEEQGKKDEEDKTALMHAVISGNLEMVKLLCQEGKIDITAFNAQDNNGMTAVMHAAELGYSDILEFFYNIPKKLTNDTCKQSLSYSARYRETGFNALVLAVKKGHVSCLKFLYTQNSISDRDSHGKTALMHAVISGNLEMVKLLCQKGKIDITTFNAQDNNGMTAVMHAAELGHSNILKFFLDEIPERIIAHHDMHDFSYITKNNISGLNALMLAIVNGHIDCLELLYYKEIQYIINNQDNRGRTPIMLVFDLMIYNNSLDTKEEIKNAQQFLYKFFQVVQTIFKEEDKRNEEHYQMLKEIFHEECKECLDIWDDNRLDLTIQDKDERNIFSCAEEAECVRELLSFISSIPINSIVPDLSIYKLSGDEQKSVKCSEGDLTDWVIFCPAPSITIENDRESCVSSQSSTIPLESSEESNMGLQGISVTPLQEPKANKRRIIKADAGCVEQEEKVRKHSNNKKVKVIFNKPDSAVTSCDMELTRFRSGMQKAQFCIKPKEVWVHNDKQSSINITPTKEWLSL